MRELSLSSLQSRNWQNIKEFERKQLQNTMNDMNDFRSRIQSFVSQVSGKSQDGSKSGISDSTSSLFTTDVKMPDLVKSFVNVFLDAKPTLTSFLNDGETTADSVFEGIKNKMFDKKPSREELVDRLRERYSTTSISLESNTFRKRKTSDADMNHLHRYQRRKQLMNECSPPLDASAFYSNSASELEFLDGSSKWGSQSSGNYGGKSMVKGRSSAVNLSQSTPYVRERSQTMSSTGLSPYANTLSRYSNLTGNRKVEVEGHTVYGKREQRNKIQNRQTSNSDTQERCSSALTVSSYNNSCHNDTEQTTSPKGQNVSASDTKFNEDQSPKTETQCESSSKQKDQTKEPLNGCNKNSPAQEVHGELIDNNTYVATIRFSVQYLIITKRLKISLLCIDNIRFPESNNKAKRYTIQVSLTGKRQKYTQSIELMNGTTTQLQQNIYFNNLELRAAHMKSVKICLYKKRSLSCGRYPVNGCVTDLENVDIVGKAELSRDMTEC